MNFQKILSQKRIMQPLFPKDWEVNDITDTSLEHLKILSFDKVGQPEAYSFSFSIT